MSTSYEALRHVILSDALSLVSSTPLRLSHVSLQAARQLLRIGATAVACTLTFHVSRNHICTEIWSVHVSSSIRTACRCLLDRNENGLWLFVYARIATVILRM